MRIISLCPSNSEILFALGAGDQVVGVEKWTDFPREARALPSVGTEMEADIEKVKSLNPDLVLASLSVPGMEKNVKALKEHNIPHLVLNPHSLEEIYADIIEVGQAINKAREARSLIQEMKTGIQNHSKKRKKPARVYLEWWPDPLISPGKYCWTRDMIQAAGGENIFGDMEKRSGTVTYSDVIDRDPDLILLCWCGIPIDKIEPRIACERKDWREIRAVKNNRVFAVEEGWYGRPGPRVVKGIQQMAQWISGHQD